MKGVESPAGFESLRVHDLRHTFGRRLRAINVSLEDREDLLGHRSGRVTTDYSAAEIRNLIQAANQVIRSRNSPELTVLRVIQAHTSA
jgi:integrase